MNEYGLDNDYFKKKLKKIVSDVKYFTPDEMIKALGDLVSVAQVQANDSEGALKKVSENIKRKKWEAVHRDNNNFKG
tara:strand:- start:644 stop:874 length:231 start_codon:yes stop_codon:yes gene_type:complete